MRTSNNKDHVFVPENGKYITFPITIWYQESDDSIHIVCEADGEHQFHTTVRRGGEKRYHPNMFNH